MNEKERIEKLEDLLLTVAQKLNVVLGLNDSERDSLKELGLYKEDVAEIDSKIYDD